MKNTILFFILFFFCNLSNSTAQNWVLESKKSKITWTGKAAFSAYTLSGTLQIKAAEVDVVENAIQSANFIFDMKTIDGENKDLTKHLKSKDFFKVKKYKTTTFKLIELTVDTDNQFIVNGEVTIKGTTKRIVFPIQVNFSNNQLTVKGQATINRTDFGITFNSPSFFEKLKDHAIADNFDLNFALTFLKE